jgi:hypothetical protein
VRFVPARNGSGEIRAGEPARRSPRPGSAPSATSATRAARLTYRTARGRARRPPRPGHRGDRPSVTLAPRQHRRQREGSRHPNRRPEARPTSVRPRASPTATQRVVPVSWCPCRRAQIDIGFEERIPGCASASRLSGSRRAAFRARWRARRPSRRHAAVCDSGNESIPRTSRRRLPEIPARTRESPH